jgi:hypothetical protein
VPRIDHRHVSSDYAYDFLAGNQSSSAMLIHHTNFVLLAKARTGSNFLATTLNTHPDINCWNECNPKAYGEHLKLFLPQIPARKNLARMLQAAFNRVPFSGYKLFYDSIAGHSPTQRIANSYYTKLLLESNCKIIHLIRPNQLDVSISLAIANKIGYWVTFDKTPNNQQLIEEYNQIKVTLSPKSILRSIRIQTQNLIETRRIFKDRIFEVTYDEIETKRDAIVEWLGGRPYPLTTTTMKQNQRPKSEIIKNYERVKKVLGPQYAWMFDG